MNKYYFCASLPLESGSIVNPGNWGRMIMKYSISKIGNPWVLLRELAYEEIRKEHYPGKPSRLDSLFLCQSEQDLRTFMQRYERLFDIAYEVELLDPALPSHVGCLASIDLQEDDNYPSLKDKASIYWQGQQIQIEEVVTTSPIKITKLLWTEETLIA